ncbi:class I adenylate-forming enzyme family protein [Mesobacterium pallidum]|uniref:class I adenylate-forming enzyme family protein n=1 Tax=Mesobacterium pallidum TaxID=2872037 RepID=UPI001EE17D95|nr:class I adenylate-forming enzyme family protein [Mesobacterium pallidum]
MIDVDKIKPISALIRAQAEQRPDKMAFADRNRRITFAELDTETENLAKGLRALGLEPGDNVAVLLPNSVDQVVSMLGIVRAGLTCMAMPYDAVAKEVAFKMTDAETRTIITRAGRRELLAGLEEVPIDTVLVTDKPKDAELPFREIVATPRDIELPVEDLQALAFLGYTSGTTGNPKGVQLRSYSAVYMNAGCMAPILGLSDRDVMVCPLPLLHAFALFCCVIPTVAQGASTYIIGRFTPGEMVKRIAEEKATVAFGVPTMYHHMLLHAEEHGLSDLSSLRFCMSAGAPLGPALFNKFQEELGVPLLDGFGSTETAGQATINWLGGKRVPGSCGIPILGVMVRVVDPETGVDKSYGEEGEMIVRGPNLMTGYHKRPEDTARALRGGWYHTGDLARYDRDGYLTVTGRLKEIIIRGGQNIAPVEIEECVLQMPGVRDCAVAGIPDEEMGEVPAVFVIGHEGKPAPTHSEIVDWCTSRLTPYKIPSISMAVPEIPRTPSGKVKRFLLVEAYEKQGLEAEA